MKEHPIPQDITNYRFHIVGSMTLKQFGEAAAGVIAGLLIYQTNLISIIKWPLIIIFAAGGFAAAFLPIEERPLSHWISTFISILYKPTQFFWKRSYNIPAPFLFKADHVDVSSLQEIDLSPVRRQRIKEFISSTSPLEGVSDFSTEERMRMSSILDIFQTQVVREVKIETSVESQDKPNLTVRVRSMRQASIEEVQGTDDRFSANSLGGTEIDTYLLDPSLTQQHLTTNKKDAYLDTQEVAQSIQIPEIQPVEVSKPALNEEVAALVQQQTTEGNERAFVGQIAPQTRSVSATDTVHFNAELPFPSKPNTPNKLVGMILTPKNELIPGAIVEIKTQQGTVSRAVKSNALGQFFITTPLENGEYVVSVEKDGYKFNQMSISLAGKIVEPLEVRSV